MRTNIVVDDALMKQAMRLSGFSTKKAVVEESLKLFVAMQKQKKLGAWFSRRGPRKSAAPQGDRLLSLAGSVSDNEAEEMLRVLYEDRAAEWDTRS